MKILLLPVLLTLLLVAPNYADAQTGQLTDLPTLYITTNEGLPVDSKSTWRAGQLTIAASSGTEGAYQGDIEIRGRGNSTWEMAKKPYRIRLASKYQLLGLPAKERNWVLLANYADKTLLRNALAFETSRFLGLPYTPPYRFVDVYLNNTYIGNYTLTDQIERADQRVPIEKINPEDTEEPAITGGYLLEADGFADQEISKFYTTRGMKITVKYPDDDEINAEQTQYISSYVQKMEDRLFSEDFQNPETGYMQYLDKTSLINWYIACEITGNSDSFWSTYMFKKKNDPKIYFGPLWDYDIAFNNDDRLGDATFKRMSEYGHFTANRVWIERMLQDPNFKEAVRARWKELKKAGLKEFLDQKIVSLSNALSQSQAKNYEVWPTLDSKVYKEYKTSGTYAEHVAFVRDYLSRRLTWLEWQLTGELGSETYYKIVNKYTGKILAPGADPAYLTQHTFVADNRSHEWILQNSVIDGTRYYTLTNRATGSRILSPNDESLSQLALTHNALTPHQQWRLQLLSDNNSFGLINRVNGLAMDNYNQSAEEGNKIIQYFENTGQNENQQWVVVETALNESPLPIYVASFIANAAKEGILLTWNVVQSQEGKHFEIQRFADPIHNETIATVPLADAGSGLYSFLDKNPLQGINYYRLKMVDRDGTYAFSKVVSIRSSLISGLAMWPVPATTEVNVSFQSRASGPGSIEVITPAGTLRQTIPVYFLPGQNKIKLPTSQLTGGLYLVRIVHEEETTVLKLLKAD